MLIKSQDGKVIVNTNTLVSLNVYKSEIYCLISNGDDERGFTIGSYDTDDEAKAALDKLYNAINEPKYDLGGGKDVEEHVDHKPGEFPF